MEVALSRQEFLRLIDGLFELEPGTLNGSEEIEKLGPLDSLAVLGFIALADEHCGVNVPAAAVANCLSVDDLVALVGARLS